MKQLADVERRKREKEKKREWHWCRRTNGFCDNPKWRLVAKRVGIPLSVVIAFVNRLDELGNEAGNRDGFVRGEVRHFNAEEFALALDIPAEQAARVFATLEDPDIGWVAFDHIANFYDRNRDSDADPTATARKRRERSRTAVLQTLAKLTHRDRITAADRFAIEADLRELDDTRLFGLEAQLSTALYTDQHVTRDGHRDIVTVTQEKIKNLSSSEISGAPAAEAPEAVQRDSGDSGDNSIPPELWLATEGRRIIAQRMNELPTRAARRIERWSSELGGDLAKLVEIIDTVDLNTDLSVSRMMVVISDAIARHRLESKGPLLPLKTVVTGDKRRASNE